MELNDVLLWMVGASCLMTLLAAFRGGVRDLAGWIGVSVFILALGLVSWCFDPGRAGYAAGIAWALLILLPSIGMRRVRAHLRRLDLAGAWRGSKVVRFLHPFDGWWRMPTLIHAQLLDDRGEFEAAHALLAPLAAREDSIGRQANHHLLRATRDWPAMVAWAEQLGAGVLRRDAALVGSYLRALGETGEIMKMLWTYDRYRGALDAPVNAPARANARLAVLALGGQVSAVEALLAGSMRDLPPAVQGYWIGTSQLAAGDVDAGRAQLTAAMPGASPAVRAAIEQRLTTPPADVRDFLRGGGDKLLYQIDLDRQHEERFGLGAPYPSRPWITYALLLANVIMFALETARGGSENAETLYRLGAADPWSVLRLHQYWRLVACAFLHFGPIHLAMNMIGLLVLGPFVERAVGRVAYLVGYLLCAVAGAAGVVWLSSRHPQRATLLVGASAAIMGLVGATAAILLAGWLRERARVAAQRLRAVAIIIVLQVTFDRFTPQVSGAAHLFGLAAGFFLLLPFRLLARRAST